MVGSLNKTNNILFEAFLLEAILKEYGNSYLSLFQYDINEKMIFKTNGVMDGLLITIQFDSIYNIKIDINQKLATPLTWKIVDKIQLIAHEISSFLIEM